MTDDPEIAALERRYRDCQKRLNPSATTWRGRLLGQTLFGEGFQTVDGLFHLPQLVFVSRMHGELGVSKRILGFNVLALVIALGFWGYIMLNPPSIPFSRFPTALGHSGRLVLHAIVAGVVGLYFAALLITQLVRLVGHIQGTMAHRRGIARLAHTSIAREENWFSPPR
ncbi:MAG: hypothetical protein AB8B51_08015 [Sedimentitalea sp.]